MSGLSAEDREALLTGVVISGSDCIHNPHCGNVVGNRWLRKPREGDRLAGCCHRRTAAATPKTVEQLVAEGIEAFREQAVAAIEAGVLPSHPVSAYRDGFATAAWIVRDLPR